MPPCCPCRHSAPSQKDANTMPTIYLKRTSPLMAQLGANIARELKKLGITQGELSERSGVAASHISYMVRGHGNPTLATLESLADAFGLSAVELLAADSTSRDKRSEEHTSELQSLMRISYAVFCLKKKKIIR